MLGELELFSLKDRRLREILYKYLIGENEEEGTRLLVEPTDKRQGGKLKTGEILAEHKHFFYCDGGQTLELISQRCYEASVCRDI